MPVEVIHWNPRRRIFSGRLTRRIPISRPVNNFGDLLGPALVERLVQSHSLPEPAEERRLVSVGSIMSLARTGDTVWGTGINGKSKDRALEATVLDVRSVRGPRTRELLIGRGFQVPPIFGDPGLLVGHLWRREELRGDRASQTLSIVPNLHDYRSQRHLQHSVNPTAPLWDVIGTIAASDFVVGSSLHGIVVAESLGIPARLVRSSTEPEFKYLDYFEGTGRYGVAFADTVEEAISMGGAPLPEEWNPEPLLEAFPRDLWAGPHARS